MNTNEQTLRFDDNDYSFNPDSKLGIYLIHGFSSTTYEVKKLAKHLASQGYYVQADNLPGHGTSIEDCNLTSYHEWLSSAEQHIATMYTFCDKIIIAGVSMGGLIALHLGVLFRVNGIISASPLIKFKSEFHVRILTRLFHKIKKTIPKDGAFQPDPSKIIEQGFYGYTHYPLSALNEMRKMIDALKPNLSKITSPTLLMHSTVDYTTPIENHQLIKDLLINSDLSTLLLNKAGHNIFDTESDEKDIVFSAIDDFIKVNFYV